MKPRGLIVHVTRAPVLHDSRLIKEACSAVRERVAARVLLLGLWRPGLSAHDTLESGVDVRRLRLRSRPLPKWLASQTIKYLEWVFQSLACIRRERPAIVHAHSLAALPIAVMARRLYGCAVVYDAHELESLKSGLHGLRQWLAKLTERSLVKRADLMMVVGGGIADWYAAHYRMARPLVVRNIPEAPAAAPDAASCSLRERCGVGDSDVLFLYIGVLGRGRSIEKLCRVFAGAAPDRHLALLGYGEFESLARQFAARHPNIHFLGAVPPSEVGGCAREADVGLCLIEPVCLSYELSLPNKLFQSLTEGVPVLINDLPEQSRFVREFGCGWIAPARDEEFRQLIDSMQPSDILTRRAGAAQAARSLSWEKEIEPYLEFCRRTLAARESG